MFHVKNKYIYFETLHITIDIELLNQIKKKLN